MQQTLDLSAIDVEQISGAVRRMLGRDEADILDWRTECIHVPVNDATAGVYRVAGTARVGEERAPWSMILKGVQLADGVQASSTDPDNWNYWKRELLFYRSGLASELPVVEAPRCFGVVERDGTGLLWLEDIAGAIEVPWPLERYYWVAHQLGLLNGHYLTGHRLPTFDFLARRWIEGYVPSFDRVRALIPEVRDHPHFRQVWPADTLEQYNALLGEVETFYAVLDELPQTFCHLDVFHDNVRVRRDGEGAERLVLLDWTYLGIAPIGAELAARVAAPPALSGEDAHRLPEVEEAVLAGYDDGLQESGWNHDPRLARLGYLASAAVRYGLMPVGVLATDDTVLAFLMNKRWRSVEEYIEGIGFWSRFLLDRADAARALMVLR